MCFVIFPVRLWIVPYSEKNWARYYRKCKLVFMSSTRYSCQIFAEVQLTYLLTYSMVQCPSWAANWFAASQEIPRISRYTKVHYRTHKRPPTASILGQPNSVHIPTSHLLEIRPNIIHPSTPRSPQWSLSLRFPHQEPIRPPLLTQEVKLTDRFSKNLRILNLMNIRRLRAQLLHTDRRWVRHEETNSRLSQFCETV
jgi:hypothetical protein